MNSSNRPRCDVEQAFTHPRPTKAKSRVFLQGLHAERLGSFLKVQHNVNSGTQTLGNPGLNMIMIAQSPCPPVLSRGGCIQNQGLTVSSMPYRRNDDQNAAGR